MDAWGVSWELFNDITGEPTDQMIDAGVKAYKETGCDFIAAIGGGSPLDSAKAIGAMRVLGGKISDYMGKEISGKFPPLVLIPTTAGTGSEATKFTVITDTEKDVKMLLKETRCCRIWPYLMLRLRSQPRKALQLQPVWMR